MNNHRYSVKLSKLGLVDSASAICWNMWSVHYHMKRRRPSAQAAQAHYRNADVTFACERCCVTNDYSQRLVWDVNGFS